MVPALARLGLKTRARQVQVTLAWERVVGEGVARQSRVVNFARGKLTVETASPALSHQLRLQRLDIAARLNLAIGERVVGDISFRLATSPPGEKPA
jgi:predicted nucleic acid-binding Zn ribbon protein